MTAMAATGGCCPPLLKVFKILFVLFFILLFLQYIVDVRRTDPIYSSSTTIRGSPTLQWPKRTQSRHCFEAIVEPSKNISVNTSSANPTNISVSLDSSEKKSAVNVHNNTLRSTFSDINVTDKDFNKTSDVVDMYRSNANVSSQSNNVSQQMYENLSDSVKDTTTMPEIGCDIPCSAIPPGLVGAIEVNLTQVTLKDFENSQLDLAPGGHYAPRHCKPNDKVAIVIPYRDREAHLAIFLNNMHPFLMKQQIEYQIYIVEQKGRGKFNRASLMNVGFIEANKQHGWNCFIFHDVDLLPMDDRNLYTCPSQPRHLSAAIDKFHFKLPYPTIFGGVSALTTEQFQKVNGFSNSFWGWGGEDDDMANRINFHNYHISRYPMSVARYTMLSHEKESPNPKRYDILTKGKKVFNTDGLSNLQYTLAETQIHKMYTLFLVELHPPS